VRLAACAKLGLRPENRVWFRAFDPRHIASPLATAHTAGVPSRFSPGPATTVPFEILYLSENHAVCLWEVEALLGSPRVPPVPHPAAPWLIINVHVILQRVADLTLVAQQRRLGTTAQELTGDWYGYWTRTAHSSVPQPTGTAPTQDLGEALFSTPGVEGFRTVSAKVPDQMNLVVFPQKLLKGSNLRYQDSAGKIHEVKG
jgi:hypothetical protein